MGEGIEVAIESTRSLDFVSWIILLAIVFGFIALLYAPTFVRRYRMQNLARQLGFRYRPGNWLLPIWVKRSTADIAASRFRDVRNSIKGILNGRQVEICDLLVRQKGPITGPLSVLSFLNSASTSVYEHDRLATLVIIDGKTTILRSPLRFFFPSMRKIKKHLRAQKILK